MKTARARRDDVLKYDLQSGCLSLLEAVSHCYRRSRGSLRGYLPNSNGRHPLPGKPNQCVCIEVAVCRIALFIRVRDVGPETGTDRWMFSVHCLYRNGGRTYAFRAKHIVFLHADISSDSLRDCSSVRCCRSLLRRSRCAPLCARDAGYRVLLGCGDDISLLPSGSGNCMADS
jgi:hypothetical protein